MQVQITFFCIHISPVRSSATAARPIVQRIFPGTADRGPLTISTMFSVDLHPVSCLTGKPRLSSRLRAAYIPVVVAVWLAGLKHQPHHHPATLGPPCYFAPSDEIRAA